MDIFWKVLHNLDKNNYIFEGGIHGSANVHEPKSFFRLLN